MIVLHIITGLEVGGAEGVLYRICTTDLENHHVVISLIKGGKYYFLLIQAGIKVYSLSSSYKSISLCHVIELWHLIRKIRPDVVQTWLHRANLYGGIIARLAGVKAVVWGIRHNTLYQSKSNIILLIIERFLALISWIVPTRIICCADRAAEEHIAIGYDTKKMIVIKNGYSLSKYRPDHGSGERFLSEFGISHNVLILGMVARFDILKDHGNLFQALNLVKNEGVKFKIILVGEGMCYTNIQLQELAMKYSLLGELYLLGLQTDIPRVMNAFDIHLLSSTSEGFPNVIAEAMACGIPCISTDVGDAAFIVGDTGWIVPPSNPLALAIAIKSAAHENLDTMCQRGQLARKRISTYFSLESMVKNYSDAYQSIMDIY